MLERRGGGVTKSFSYSSRISETVTLTHNTALKEPSVCVCSALPLIETGPTGSYYSGVAQSETPAVNDGENSGSEESRD